METNTGIGARIMLIVAILAVVGGVVYVLQNAQKETKSSAMVLQGTVTGADVDGMRITINTAMTNPLKVVAVSQATKIEKIISQKDAGGKVEKQAVIEVNIGDVQKGSLVTVFYQSEKDGVLSGASRITFFIEKNIDAYFKSQSASQTPYIKGQVVAIDIAGKTLQYKPIMFDTTSTTTMSVSIPDDISVYRVDDPARISITHARTTTKLADVQSGQTIFIMADAALIKTGKIVPQALIILESK